MNVECTYCSGPKRDDHGLLPALERYRSSRIRSLAGLAVRRHSAFFILSGEFGLIAANTPIPFYDHLLQGGEIEKLAAVVVRQLTALSISAVSYHTADPENVPQVRPYLEVLKKACALTGVELTLQILPGNPD